MTYIEQTCHRHAVAIWRQRHNLKDFQSRLLTQVLVWSEISGTAPTSSASVLVYRSAAAIAAETYRGKAPIVSQWVNAIAAEPRLLHRNFSRFCASAMDEIRLHQNIVARIVVPARVR